MERLIDLAPGAWILLALAGTIVGLSKTALPGANTISIAVFAAILPARTSTGALLLLLIVGDMFALLSYRRHAHWPTLLRLAPAVAAGLVLGAVFLAFAGNGVVRPVIGAILLAMTGITLWRRRRAPTAAEPHGHLDTTLGYGTLGGFTTMVANAGGPVMSLYFLAMRTPVNVFLGTAAWFFAIVNLVKVPVLVGLGLITAPVLLLDAVLVPMVVLGALFGRWLIPRIHQGVFDRIVLMLTVLGAAYLLIP
ncbi:sulfite exporter TauE/SafE family protein [Microbacterium capsulatum]|uniref:Probable membrane transporter protein n=1 Tax=Microbacterium capsulatum TaxID=3041921 RepID=A0ABU0XIA9_9MICO|nr:sulfite exporter TauE/SafE family protein [Microbacterium sp. ASV81]MDQ4214854.1 sulfite exporter TauE/SafE family protein [Microbacterium sp. ASV81]